MTNFRVIESGSSGNCYLLETKKDCIILEAGVRLANIMKYLKKDVICQLISHEHGDHAEFLSDYYRFGFKIFSPFIIPFFKNEPIEAMRKIKIGDYTITPIELYHDIKCYGYIIQHDEFDNFFFATDTSKIPYTINGLINAAIECNYDDESLINSVMHGNIPATVANRIQNTHMSMNEVISFMRRDPKLRKLILLHSSAGNFNEKFVVSELKKYTSADIIVAKPNVNVEFIKF